MRARIVIANWKMNGSRQDAARWMDEFLSSPPPACRTVLCAPAVYLAEIAARAAGSHLEVGAQNVNENPAGAFTGEISCGMLSDIGVTCAIVGHSERRSLFGESDNRVAMKALALVKAGMKPIVCVGETLADREKGETPAVILRQLNAVLAIVKPEELGAVAYEPVWAIGTGKTATPETAQAVHALIRERLIAVSPEGGRRTPILYGGSVKPENARALFQQPDIDGALVGGASLAAASFRAIASAF